MLTGIDLAWLWLCGGGEWCRRVGRVRLVWVGFWGFGGCWGGMAVGG